LAAMKAGGAYTPLDPASPAARMRQILADGRVRVVVTEATHRGLFVGADAALLCLDLEQDSIASESEAALASPVHPLSAAYVIYTSGSTGKPKGVAVPHAALVSFVEEACAMYALAPTDRYLQFSALTFD